YSRFLILVLCLYFSLLSLSPFPAFFFLLLPLPPRPTLFPYTTLFRSDLLFGAGFAVLAIASAMAPASLARPATSPVVLLGLVLRSEEHTSELQSRFDLVCRLLLEKKKTNK